MKERASHGWAEREEPSQAANELTVPASADPDDQFVTTNRSHSDESDPRNLPQRIGRYVPERVIGQAGFGIVYAAFDEQLRRSVAIKVPRPERVSRKKDIQAYLEEARMVAALDHTNIVPVHDFGHTEDGHCYMVSKLIDGTDLAQTLASEPLKFERSVEIVATVAEALHHAHTRPEGLVHRDVKPGNILIEKSGKPYLTDFGLAIREEDFGRAAAFAGTVPYMSPEQARWEGHRVDGRSDVFSLGTVFYELLTGERPFRADSREETLERIKSDEPRPPRQRNDSIPRELQRICLKALSKRVADRYETALDMAEDLRRWLREDRSGGTAVAVAASDPPTSASADLSPVLPKGLRSFDANDSEFFLNLLPGPQDRHGLPESIRFWKQRIESTDPNEAFHVGVIYGPSGSGKSSLLKAGLLPRLDKSVAVVYVESTPDLTAERLRTLLQRKFSRLKRAANLSEMMVALRRGGVAREVDKVLIVLDQFEQWLHVRDQKESDELVDALRQCDGVRVQCLLTVRDDFWMGISRFAHDMEIELIPGQNVMPIDLFSMRHARRVLRSFGTALGALPGDDDLLTVDQIQFLDESIAALSEANKIIPVRLSFFTEMLKDRAWTTSTLLELGGASGVGVAFLEDVFHGPSASPEHRAHERAAREVLDTLLPDDGTNIKGRMRSYKELRDVCGYENASTDFRSLMRILDKDLRLITPTEIDADRSTDSTRSSGIYARPEDCDAGDATRYYHLTHDYLVPPLRDWLRQKQNQSVRGRSLLRLEERATVWQRQPIARNLPSFAEWLSICLFTQNPARHAGPARSRMMDAANRLYGLRLAALAAAFVFSVFGIYQWNERVQARGQVDALKTARIADVPRLIQRLKPYGGWAAPMLMADLETSPKGSAEELHLTLLMASADPNQQIKLGAWLLDADPERLSVICEILGEQSKDTEIVAQLQDRLESTTAVAAERFRAGVALAKIGSRSTAPLDISWEKHAGFLAGQLIQESDDHPEHYQGWLRNLQPLAEQLVDPLVTIFTDSSRSLSHRNLAALLLRAYVDDERKLSEIALLALPSQLERLRPTLDERRTEILPLMEAIVERPFAKSDGLNDDQRNRWARRRASASTLLLDWGRPQGAVSLLQAGPDNRSRSYLLARARATLSNSSLLLGEIERATDPSVRSGLILILASIDPPSASTAGIDESNIRLVRRLFTKDPSCLVHSSAEWALRRWNDRQWLTDMQTTLARKEPLKSYQWYINPEGITMRVFRGPILCQLGSPESEPGRDSDESQRTRWIRRDFAVSTKEISKQQFLRFAAEKLPEGFRHEHNQYIPEPDCPINAMRWFDGVQYCRWLSEQEEVAEDQMCYEQQSRINSTMRLPGDCIARTGYRLPTEAEWEYAARAGSVTSAAHGTDPELLPLYAWYMDTSRGRSWPVGTLWPNEFGMFDMYGNVQEWCHDAYEKSPATDGDDGETPLEGNASSRVGSGTRVAKGSGYQASVRNLRTANRRDGIPFSPGFQSGFRIARTLGPSEP